ncbi:MAG: NUDIX domain-containing protein [Chloroflexi bacterium]|nr:NUDIX domain-containing protein [Chloroflexota bacterium]
MLRLGVACAVFDDEGRVLLSRRGDLNVWNLPGGRLDAGEKLVDAAAREVREETGIIAHIDRAVGLYYLNGWNRLNVLYVGWPLGGRLQTTDESRDNAYFDLKHLPGDVIWEWLLFDALAEERPLPRVIDTPPDELKRVKRQLRWRWVKNLLAARPEPRYPRFDVRAVGVIWDEAHLHVLTLPGKHGQTLPRVTCSGARAPWDELADSIQVNNRPGFHWVGVWQDTARDMVELIFAATVAEDGISDVAEWSVARSAALTGPDAEYVERVKPSYARDLVWAIMQDAENIIHY